MLDDRMVKILNAQIANEAFASSSYLAMAIWCDEKSLEGCASFLYRQSDEERAHMLKLVAYINEMDAKAVVPAIPQPEEDYKTIKNLFKKVYAQEQSVTASINDIVTLCYELNDHATLSFIQWYVEEQREEEGLVRGILDKIDLIGDGPQSLYYIDKEVNALNKQELKSEGN